MHMHGRHKSEGEKHRSREDARTMFPPHHRIQGRDRTVEVLGNLCREKSGRGDDDPAVMCSITIMIN